MSIDISSVNTRNVKKQTSTAARQREVSFSLKSKINDKEKAQIYKDLGVLIKAGVDFQRALTILRDQQKKKLVKETLDVILIDVIKGKSFHEAMAATRYFSTYEVYSIKIGEETHQLDNILYELHTFFDRKVKLKKQVTSIVIYPIFILVLTFATLYFMLRYVVPLFESVFNQFNKELPTLTKYVITLSENFNLIFFTVIGIILIMFLIFHKIKNTQKYKRVSSKIISRIPFFGKLVKEIYLTRFCQSMALLLLSKSSLVESLSLVKKMIGFYPIEKALDHVEIDIKRGHDLGDSLSKFKIFDNNLISMVRVAEEVNELDTMFMSLANQYDEEVGHKTKAMGSVIEPMLILFIGSIVGVIMISMYAPMFDLSEVIGNN